MNRRWSIALAVAMLGALVPWATPSGAPAAPSHRAAADRVIWLCHPGLRDDPCEISLKTTELMPGGGAKVVTPRRAPSKQRPIDCFYVYPTVSNQPTPNATKARDPELVSIAKYQAARYSSLCRMYTPIYRQVTLAGIATAAAVQGFEKAYGDVLQAWRSYLEHDNHGRGVVLIGHSQGSLMLRKLIHEQIDAKPSVRKRLVGAVLLGGNVTVEEGKTTGGDFTHVPICTRRGEIGCVTAFSTYSTDPTVSFFGNTHTDIVSSQIGLKSGAGYEVACTDPHRLSRSSNTQGVMIPTDPFAPGPIAIGIQYSSLGMVPTAKTPWVLSKEHYRGSCETINGSHVYRYNPVGDAFRPMEFPPTWGTHLFDMNLGLGRLVDVVRQQRATYLKRR